jgi:ATP-dependent Clp protease, protease subunit
MAGSKVSIAENAMLMIHNTWGLAVGNAAEMRAVAATLDKVDGQIAEIYRARTGKPLRDIRAAMDAETYYTGAEAKTAGFVDSVIPNKNGGESDGEAANAARRRRIAIAERE